MRLKKLINSIVYTQDINDYLNNLKPFVQENWKIGNKEMLSFKAFIKSKMENIQDNKCAYCGFELNVTSGPEIEHIAPKANKHHPEFMFERENLVLSCHLCNGRSHKGEKDTISNYDVVYKNCEFTIVHPYYDDPDDHYEYLPSDGNEPHKIIIKKRNGSSKATVSIEMFDLNHEAKMTERAEKAILAELHQQSNNLYLNQLLHDSLSYKSSKFD